MHLPFNGVPSARNNSAARVTRVADEGNKIVRNYAAQRDRRSVSPAWQGNENSEEKRRAEDWTGFVRERRYEAES